MSKIIWKSQVDYVEEAKTLAFNGQIEFVPESLTSLNLTKYFDECPELERIIGSGSLEYNSPNLQQLYDFIENDSYLSDQIYDDWIKDYAEKLAENNSTDLEKSNREHLDTLIDIAELNKTCLIGCYDNHLLYVPEVSADNLIDRYNRMEFNDLDDHSVFIDVTSFEFNEIKPNTVKIKGFDNHEEVEITLYTGRNLKDELKNNKELEETLSSFLKNCPLLNEELFKYDSFLLKDLKEMELEKARKNSNGR